MTNQALEYFEALNRLLAQTQIGQKGVGELSLEEGCKQAVDWILATKSASTKIMLVGNGGSAAVVSHIQNDLCDSAAVRAIVFNEAPFLTAVANDHGYEIFFEQAVKLWAEPGDLLIAVSSSGRSKNILQAVRAAREKNCKTMTFSGFMEDNPLRQLGDLNFYVASNVYGHVETAHAVLGHFLTDSVCAAQKEERTASARRE